MFGAAAARLFLELLDLVLKGNEVRLHYWFTSSGDSSEASSPAGGGRGRWRGILTQGAPSPGAGRRNYRHFRDKSAIYRLRPSARLSNIVESYRFTTFLRNSPFEELVSRDFQPKCCTKAGAGAQGISPQPTVLYCTVLHVPYSSSFARFFT